MNTLNSFNVTPENQVQIICNSTLFDFQFNGTEINFDVNGEDGTLGFCRTCIPTALINGYRGFVNGTEVNVLLLPFSNSTHEVLYFNYTHTTHEIIVTSPVITSPPPATIHDYNVNRNNSLQKQARVKAILEKRRQKINGAGLL